MKRNNRRSILLALALSATCAAVYGVKLQASYASADVNAENYFIPGASVRIDADGENGIKFPVYMTVDAYENMGDVLETGTLVIPTDILDGELTVETENASKAVTTDGWGKVTDGGTEYYSSLAYLWDIPVSSYTREITAVGYLKYSDTEYVYTEPVSKSFNEVATAALADSTQDWTTDEEAVLNSYLQKAPDGTVLDFTENSADKGWSNAGLSVTYESSFKGATDVLKVVKEGSGAGIGNTNNWKPAYWANYYDGYDTISVAVYVDGGITGFNYVAQDAYPMPEDADPMWNYNLHVTNLEAGWNYVNLIQDTAKTQESSVVKAFMKYYKQFMQNPMFWVNGTGTFYIDGLQASVSKNVTPASTAAYVAIGDQITLSDDSASVLAGYENVSVKVYGGLGDVIVPVDGKFTVPSHGNYTVVYTATDADGKAVSASYTITASDRSMAGKVYDFSTNAVLSGAGGSNATWEFVTDGGEEGVMKITFGKAGEWTNHWLLRNKYVYSKEYYTAFDTIVFRVRTDKVGGLQGNFGDEALWNFPMHIKATEEWTEVAVSNEFFLTNFDSLKNKMFLTMPKIDAVGETYYISEIYMAKNVTVTASAKTFKKGEVTLADDAASVLAGYSNVQCEVLAPTGGTTVLKDGKFTAATTGTYTVIYTAFDADGVFVRGAYTVSVVADTKAIVDLTVLGDYSTSDWSVVGEMDGESNVVKYTEANAGTQYSWAFRGKFLGTKEDYALYTKLVFRVKRDENGGTGLKMYAEKNYTSTGGLNNPGIWVHGITTEWQDIEVDIANFYTYFDGFNSNCNWQTYTDHKAGGNIYIAGIWAK